MGRDHNFFVGNSDVFNKHSQVCTAAAPVIRALLRANVRKINTSHFSESRGRSVTVSRTPTGLEVQARGDGLRQIIFVCTDDPVTVERLLGKKFHAHIK